MTTDSKQKTSRKLETREQQTRKKGWTPPSNLDAPEPPEGFHHRWVRFEYRGTQDDKNVVARIRSGYEAVKADEYPDRIDLPHLDAGKFKGSYIATIDNYHSNVNTIDYSTSETPAEHKSHNLIELENGQFGLYPNNRMRIYDNSLTPDEPTMPDFKVSTREYQVENDFNLSRYGDSDDYFYKSKDEK